jgi:hypothetical protein
MYMHGLCRKYGFQMSLSLSKDFRVESSSPSPGPTVTVDSELHWHGTVEEFKLCL